MKNYLSTDEITTQPDGSLKIMPSLRKQMQLLLDEVQSTGVDELDKVSLERHADINPDLLRQIKEESEIVLREQKMGSIPSSTGAAGHTSTISSHSNGNITNDWSKLKLNHLEKSNTIVTKLQRHVRSACDQNTMVVKSQVDDTVHSYAAVSASAQVLTDMLHQFQLQEKENYNTNILGNIGVGSGSGDSSRKKRYSLVRQEKFTTDGLKERNDAVVSRLYEVGLPFVCSADGRRFGTQIELSKHLDMLFKRRLVGFLVWFDAFWFMLLMSSFTFLNRTASSHLFNLSFLLMSRYLSHWTYYLVASLKKQWNGQKNADGTPPKPPGWDFRLLSTLATPRPSPTI